MILPHDVYILRHGETEWNVKGRLQGAFDSPLTARGIAQARTQAEILAAHAPPGARVIASPSGRALTTAALALGRPETAITTDPRLREIDLGDWSGAYVAELARSHPGLTDTDDPVLWKFDAPRGERMEQMTARCRDLLGEIDGPTILITHGVTSQLLRALLTGRRPEDLGAMPCGQGIVHHVVRGTPRLLDRP